MQGGSKGYKVWDWNQPWNESVGIKFKLGCSIRGSHTCWYRADWSSFYGETNSAIGYSSGTMRKKTGWRWERLVGLWSHSMLTTLGWCCCCNAALQPRGTISAVNTAMMHVTQRLSVQQEQFVQHSTTAVCGWQLKLPSANEWSWRFCRPFEVPQYCILAEFDPQLNLFREFTASIPILVGYYNSQLDPLKRSPYFFVKSPQSGSGWWENPQGRPSGIPMGSHTLLSQLDKLGLYPTYIYRYTCNTDIYIYNTYNFFCVSHE